MDTGRGYVVIAQNSGDVDYLEQAYALALNLKITQSEVSNLTVCVDAETRALITEKHIDIFDNIIDIPWLDAAKGETWKIHNKWKYYHMTPYDETVILDADMIFPTDVSYWWDILSQRDVWSSTHVRTFRNEVVSSDYYRKCFTANDLPNVYTAFFYFKKSDLATELFSMIEVIFQHWERFYHKYVPLHKPDYLSGDVAFALAMKILGVTHLCTCDSVDAVPTFVHMKSHVQNISGRVLHENWNTSLPTYWKSCDNFMVGNFTQTMPFHYVDPLWMTKQRIESMENML